MNEYSLPPEIMRSLKAGLPPRRPAFPKIKPWEERTPRAREKLTKPIPRWDVHFGILKTAERTPRLVISPLVANRVAPTVRS